MSLSFFIRKLFNGISLQRKVQTFKHCLGRKLYFSSYEATIEDNPFYEKYKLKMGELQTHLSKGVNNPPRRPQQQQISDSPTASSHSRSLDSILDTSAMVHKTAEEIAGIWNSHHSNLDCIHGTLPASIYALMSTQGTLCPHFIYPLPSDTGYRFMFQQYSVNEFHFTTLEDYKLLKEHAPIYLTLSYYTQFADKNIVLMAGKYNLDKLKVEEAQLIAQLLQLTYGQNKLERIELIRKFNFTPNLFDYKELIQQFEKLKIV